MMLRTELGRIPTNDLDRFRAIAVRRRSWESNPSAYSATEGEQILMAMLRADAELVVMFDIDETRTWQFSSLNGVVYYEDE